MDLAVKRSLRPDWTVERVSERKKKLNPRLGISVLGSARESLLQNSWAVLGRDDSYTCTLHIGISPEEESRFRVILHLLFCVSLHCTVE